MLTFSIHFIFLVAINVFFLRRKNNLSFDLKIFAAVILMWSSLIYAADLLSCFNLFGNNILFAATSLIIQIVLSFLLSRLLLDAKSSEEQKILLWIRSTFNSWPRRLAAFLFLFLCFMLLVSAFSMPLQIPDTIAMKLPNAFFYLQNGNFIPPMKFSDDGRLFGTPFNGTILWSYLIRWKQPEALIMLFNFCFYILVIGVVYRLSRLFGVSRWGSLTSSLLFAFSLNMLFQGSTDNDDLMSAAPAAMGSVFLIRWLKTQSYGDIVLSALGLGISLGAKFTPGLYLPAVIIFVSYFIIKNFGLRFRELVNRGVQILIASFIGLSMIVPFLVARFLFTGKFDYMTPILRLGENKPFRLEVGLHNLIAYNLQLFLSPLPDLLSIRSGIFRSHVVEVFNQFLVGHFVPKVENVYAYVTGVNIALPDVYGNTVWYGLLAWIVGMALIRFLFVRKWRFRAPFWIAVFFICWDVLFCLRSLYIEELGRYWILPMALVLPLVGILWDEIQLKQILGHRFLRYFYIFVWIIMPLTGIYALYQNSIGYGLHKFVEHTIFPQVLSPKPKQLLAKCDQTDINIVGTIYGYPIYTFMHEYRGNQLYFMYNLKKNAINLLAALNVNLDHTFYTRKFIAVDLKSDLGEGYKDLENTAYGVPVYVSSPKPCPCAEACPSANSFLIVQLKPDTDHITQYMKTEVSVMADDLSRQYEYRALAKSDHSQEQILKDWTTDLAFEILVPMDLQKLEVQARRAEGPLKNKPLFSGLLSIH